MVAPHNLRERFIDLIRREAEHALAGRPCGIRAKMNQLQDGQIIRELYLASQAGVPMDLNVRGLCCLRAGVPGLSESIRVYSTLGRFLEHGRIYRFENGGEPEFFIGSADWMSRNLSRRMETIAPVCDPAIRAELEEILRVYEDDNCSAWDMQPDGSYVRRRPAEGEACRAAQQVFIEQSRGPSGPWRAQGFGDPPNTCPVSGSWQPERSGHSGPGRPCSRVRPPPPLPRTGPRPPPGPAPGLPGRPPRPGPGRGRA